ncbi:hypothetical protein WA577_001694, partial [Blastocystis sp. JDR]
YDWRAKTPVIFRVTPQWFVDIKRITQDGRLEQQLRRADLVPAASRARLLSMIQTRPDWCISRQRAWGVPIPIVFRRDGAEETPITDPRNLDFVIALLRDKGTDYWFGDASDAEFVAPELRRELPATTQFRRCRDTMDVWLDSGVSWFANYPQRVADLYLEGSDQHRGWFQSSIYTSFVMRQCLPFQHCVTHGFLV